MSDVFFEFNTVMHGEVQKITLLNSPVMDSPCRKRGFIEVLLLGNPHSAFIWQKRGDTSIEVIALRSSCMNLIGKQQEVENIINEKYKKTIEELIVDE